MKPHIIIKLQEGFSVSDPPHWSTVIEGMEAPARLHPRIDSIMARYKIPFLATHEYIPKTPIWSEEEVKSGLSRVFRLVLLKENKIPADLIKEISFLPFVDEVRIGQVGGTELPTVHAAQMNNRTDMESRDQIYLPEAQRYTRGDNSVIIAVLDTGISMDHEELQRSLMPGRDFVDIIDGATQFFGDHLGVDDDPSDEVGHGTHVAGIIAGSGVAMPEGVVPDCRILPVRVLAAMKQGTRKIGAGLVDNINTGIKWAVDKGAGVINMSLGIRHMGGGLPHRDVVDYAERKGVSIIAAAGNDGSDNLYYPGAFDTVIAVGAADKSGEVAPYSTYGPQISLIAPGNEIYSSYLNNDYAFSSGTSHAAPFVTGAVAMLKSFAGAKGRRLSPRGVRYILEQSADKIDRRFKHHKAGFGRLNLIDALKLLEYKLA